MYDFFFGSTEQIAADERRFLLSVKRMLPRWLNSIPDSEYLAIFDILEAHVARERPVLVETGVGASSIVLLYHAFKHGGVLYSWDFVGPKGAYLRGVVTDTLVPYFKQCIADHWRFVAASSHSAQLGIPILGEFKEVVDFGFFDSEHTLDVLMGELERVAPFMRDGGVIALDDANYDFRHVNMAYANMLRRKLGLPPAAEQPGNRCRPFWVEAEAFLLEQWSRVSKIEDSYKATCRTDLFFSYYNADRVVMDQAGMEKLDQLEHRFDAWKVASRRPRA